MSMVEHGELSIRETVLPANAPEHLVVTPTMDRWQNGHGTTPLPDLIRSVQGVLSSDGLSEATWMVIGDASSKPGTEELRERLLREALQEVDRPTRIFFITPETQARVAQLVEERTHVNWPVIEAILTETGYASQRAKLDIVAGGLVHSSGHDIKVVTFDDDVVVPHQWDVLRREALPEGLDHAPNSQVLLPNNEDALSPDMFHRRDDNSMKPFFDSLGKTVGQLRYEQGSDFHATEGMTDTMHGALTRAAQGEAAQFFVRHADEEELPQAANQGIVIAATATKHLRPDYRTVSIAEANLLAGFPEEEVPVSSFPSGLNQLFAFLGCNTNVDSAAFARLFTKETAVLPWWFVSSDRISRRNPLQTVTGHYRADNELLPVLFEVTRDVTDRLYLYVGGIDTQIQHFRARSGYRPNIIEQATASLVGNVAALEAARRLDFDRTTGIPRIRREGLDDSYQAPREHAMQVFDSMRNLAQICEVKVAELQGRYQQQQMPDEMREKIQMYLDTHNSIRQKLGSFDFEVFYQHLNVEIRDQLLFFADVVEATPVVMRTVGEMIAAGEYPVLEAVALEISSRRSVVRTGVQVE